MIVTKIIETIDTLDEIQDKLAEIERTTRGIKQLYPNDKNVKDVSQSLDDAGVYIGGAIGILQRFLTERQEELL